MLSKYNSLINSNNGMNTKIWGPKLWDFLFISILGAFPVKIDKYNNDHIKIKKHFKKMLLSLEYTLPCVYCRDSYKVFIKKHNIKPFLKSRLLLLYWLYRLKDMVNKKLINQENKKFLELSKNFTNKNELSLLRKEIFYTKPSPSFISVLLHYEQFRSI